MRCSLCGGLVEWQGPLTDLCGTKCLSCGGTNCQEVEPPPPVSACNSLLDGPHEEDLTYRDYPMCPLCGYEERDAWEIDFPVGAEEVETYCNRCGKEMVVERHVSVYYSTKRPKAV